MKTKNCGILESIFPCDITRVLDHLIAMQEFDYSISDISFIVELRYNTTSDIIKKLENYGLVRKTRTMENKIMYQTDTGMKQTKHINNAMLVLAGHKIREKW